MDHPQTVTITLSQAVGFIKHDFYARNLKRLNDDFTRGKMHENIQQFNWVPFMTELLKEVFADTARTPLRPAGWISPSAKALLSVGYDARTASFVANEVLKIVIGEITLILPDLCFADIEDWQWGICEPEFLMITFPAHAN